ncbi:hypothetical protein BDV34DRAFT_192757 [Aspergillus parasiticus]|uniref:Uncharacterized protein n=1 Tax=Aspergillus parasiticus TaxID=5067 RepID=A0A5N6DPK5_ASPPA|nr:hypothetical protein BDV34DRAFT_192757 [Aspergillus parasiticus]
MLLARIVTFFITSSRAENTFISHERDWLSLSCIGTTFQMRLSTASLALLLFLFHFDRLYIDLLHPLLSLPHFPFSFLPRHGIPRSMYRSLHICLPQRAYLI